MGRIEIKVFTRGFGGIEMNGINFNLTCEVCTQIVPLDRIYLAQQQSLILVCVDCTCGANNIIKIIEKKVLLEWIDLIKLTQFNLLFVVWVLTLVCLGFYLFNYAQGVQAFNELKENVYNVQLGTAQICGCDLNEALIKAKQDYWNKEKAKDLNKWLSILATAP